MNPISIKAIDKVLSEGVLRSEFEKKYFGKGFQVSPGMELEIYVQMLLYDGTLTESENGILTMKVYTEAELVDA